MINKIIIYGERCSGTNYLEELLKNNFKVEIIEKYCHKHFFGHDDLSNVEDDILFIGIVRNIIDWINSLYREKYHLHKNITSTKDNFLNKKIISIYKNKEIIKDRHIYTKQRYKNIFELRHIKNKFLVEDMPQKVKNYILITYDNLIADFTNIMTQIKMIFDLPIKESIEFPLNIQYYKANKKQIWIKKTNNIIFREEIIPKANLYYEKILFGDNY